MEKAGVFNFGSSKKVIAIASLIFLGVAIGCGTGFAQNVVLLIFGSIFLLWLVGDLYRGLLLGIIAINLNRFMFETGITPVGITLRPAQIVFAALLLVWIILLIVRRVHFHRTPLDIPIIGYLLVSFVSSLLKSPDKMMSIQECTLLTVYALMYFLTVNVLLEYPDKIKKVVKFLLILSVVHCLYAVVRVFSYTMMGIDIDGLQRVQGGHAVGFFHEPNLLGIYATVILMFLASRLLHPNIKHKFGLYIGMIITIMAVILAITRSSWVAFPFGIGAMLMVRGHKTFTLKYFARVIKIVFIVAIVLVTFWSLGPYYISDFSQKFETFETKAKGILDLSSSSAAGRILTYGRTIEDWKNSKLIGYGVSSKGWLLSSFIQTLNDTGIIGLFFMFWIHLLPIILAYKMVSRTRDIFVRYSLMGFIGGCIVLLITCQSSNFLWLGFPWVFYGIGMAIVMRAKALVASEGIRDR